MGRLHRDVGLQLLENKALSWGITRKSACILAEITIRKSHPLEGSCQEAIPLPSTPFDMFFVCSARHTPPPIGHLRRIRVFIPVASAPCAAPVTHQDQGLVTSRSCARRLFLASRMFQKTFGFLLCPIVYSVQIAWLPLGSNFYRAHGRGVAPLGHSVAGHLSWVETGTNQIGWMLTNSSPSLRPQPHGGPDLSQKLSSPHRAQGLASCNNKPETAYGPRLSVPGLCCYGS